ncbi:GNAT family N-acetyltransferase [Actinophytocola sp.]|uniref:GNAT family N-acetyltransferase n=1 Tax=Actinophytocola sp. TaxID=1872138 RepID=UPI002ED49864
MSWEVLDPRYDAEPAYWRDLRARAGLRAEWAWEVLSAQAWSSRTPLLVSVLRAGAGVEGVVCASWAGLPVRRNGFVDAGRARMVGGLHVRNPGTGSLPGWWAAGVPAVELLRDYTSAMRRALGFGCRGALLRQLTAEEVAQQRTMGRCLSRPTESLAVLWTSRFSSVAGWVSAMKRSRRFDMRKIIRTVDADAALVVAVEQGSALDPLELAKVLRHNERKYSGRLAPLPQTTGYLTALLSQPDVLVGTYRDAATGAIEAFISILDHPAWPVTRHWSSMPATRPDRPNLYLDHYRQLVAYAQANGKEGVIVGRGKPELKASLTAELVPQYAAAIY